MKRVAWLPITLLWLIASAASPQVKGAAQPAKFSIMTRLDKTALWVGDRLSYKIQVIHDPDIEFVLDQLKKERLSLAPFVLREIAIRQGKWAGGKRRLEITLLLSSYEIGRPELTIPSLDLYYFIHDPAAGKREPQAQVAKVPAMRVGLRSTLSGGPPQPRDAKPIVPRGIGRGLLALVLGLAGMIFLAVRGARRIWTARAADREKKPGLSPQARARLAQEGWARIRALGGESPEDLTRFYTETSQFLRHYLSQWLEIETAGLTPEEIEAALERAKVDGPIVREVRAVLEQCDAVRYGRDGLKLGAELRPRLLEAVERILRPQPA